MYYAHSTENTELSDWQLLDDHLEGAVTPGPGIFYVAARTLAGGRAEGIASSFGTGLGGMVHVLAGSLGVSAIVLASADLFTALKLIGAAYLVWLGLRTFQAARREAATVLDGGAVAPVGARRAFREPVAALLLSSGNAGRVWPRIWSAPS
jgi:threonine/homoserine/homoserine lactone efflux protein